MKNWVSLLLLGLLAFQITACTKKENQIEYGLKVEETLRININSEPPSLDWNKSTDTTSALIQDNIMVGLVEYDFSDPKLGLEPALATEWSSGDKARVWTFTLRDDVVWNDGQKFTPQHVLDGWERLLNPKTASEYAYFLYNIKNARAYNEGKIDDFSKVGASLNEEGQLVVELEQGASYFPYLLTHHSTYPIRKDVIAKHGDQWTEPGHIVTLGAYNLKVWDHDKAIVMERNDQYYGEKAKTKNILAYMINEQSTALSLFDSGKLDALNSLPSRELVHLRQRDEYKTGPILVIYYYGFNTEKAPFDNVKVRQAIGHAVDRSELVKLLGGGETPLTGWVPPGMFGYEKDVGRSFDIKKAKKLLEEAGFKDPTKVPTITIGFNTNEDHQRIAENIQAQLKRNLGLNVELRNEEWKVYLDTLKTDTPHIFRLGWLADFPDPDNFMSLMASYSDNNHTKWKSQRYDELIKEAVSLTDRDERAKLYKEAQELLAEKDMPVIPLYAGVSHLLVSDRVQNYPINSMGRFIYKGVSLK